MNFVYLVQRCPHRHGRRPSQPDAGARFRYGIHHFTVLTFLNWLSMKPNSSSSFRLTSSCSCSSRFRAQFVLYWNLKESPVLLIVILPPPHLFYLKIHD